MIQTEDTPNPNSLKFLSEKTISAIGTEEFQKEKQKMQKRQHSVGCYTTLTSVLMHSRHDQQWNKEHPLYSTNNDVQWEYTS